MNIISETLRGLVTPVSAMSLAFLLIIQVDEEQNLLVNTHRGIGLVVLILMAIAIASTVKQLVTLDRQ